MLVSKNGFSLIELLIALAIIFSSITALYVTLHDNIQNYRRVEAVSNLSVLALEFRNTIEQELKSGKSNGAGEVDNFQYEWSAAEISRKPLFKYPRDANPSGSNYSPETVVLYNVSLIFKQIDAERERTYQFTLLGPTVNEV